MVKVGVIGAGRWGKNHLRVFSELNCELIGVADPDPKTEALAEQYGITHFKDYKDMIKGCEAVTVATPTDSHHNIVKECLLMRKHVLVEKPITLDASEAKELMDIAKEKGLILAVGYLFRFNNAVKALKEQIKSVGDINYITAAYTHSTKPARKDCGVIFNFGVHLIDILSFVLERKPKRIFCKKHNYLSEDREDAAIIILDYGDFIAELEASWLHPLKRREMWVIGSKEKIFADLFEQIVIKHPIEVGYDKVIHKKEINLEVRKNEPLKDELKHFIEIVGDKKADNFASEEYETTKICELCLKSAMSGEEIGYEKSI
ncbi:Gfo/Idh/MocA family oxidoreductase [Candidatus Woesearchaeota archaeon]|nr:Gfo/Idh/MocA family oxidoreductase [Candidatus Woesearchaeota archaeon]